MSYLDESGSSVSGVGDLNGDGYADLLVNSPYSYNTYVIYGSSSIKGVELTDIPDSSVGFTVQSTGRGTAFSVAGAGDVDGDGVGDLLISGQSPARSFPTAFVVFGKGGYSKFNVMDIQRGNGGFAILSGSTGESLANKVARVGDVIGDGLSDILLTADDGTGGPNKVYVVFGKSDGVAVSITALDRKGFAIVGDSGGDRTDTPSHQPAISMGTALRTSSSARPSPLPVRPGAPMPSTARPMPRTLS